MPAYNTDNYVGEAFTMDELDRLKLENEERIKQIE
jgi:hypothetical protein